MQTEATGNSQPTQTPCNSHGERILHQIVRFAAQLHIAVLNPVMHHFDVVARPALAHPVTTPAMAPHTGGYCV